jgi:hypothetical protein
MQIAAEHRGLLVVAQVDVLAPVVLQDPVLDRRARQNKTSQICVMLAAQCCTAGRSPSPRRRTPSPRS